MSLPLPITCSYIESINFLISANVSSPSMLSFGSEIISLVSFPFIRLSSGFSIVAG